MELSLAKWVLSNQQPGHPKDELKGTDMKNAYTLSVNGSENVEYSSKKAAIKHGDASGKSYFVLSPTGLLVHTGEGVALVSALVQIVLSDKELTNAERAQLAVDYIDREVTAEVGIGGLFWERSVVLSDGVEGHRAPVEVSFVVSDEDISADVLEDVFRGDGARSWWRKLGSGS